MFSGLMSRWTTFRFSQDSSAVQMSQPSRITSSSVTVLSQSHAVSGVSSSMRIQMVLDRPSGLSNTLKSSTVTTFLEPFKECMMRISSTTRSVRTRTAVLDASSVNPSETRESQPPRRGIRMTLTAERVER